MSTVQTLRIAKITTLVILTALALGCGYSSKATPPTAGSVPTISQLSPASMKAGSAAFMLTVNGTNFSGKAIVNWNNSAQSTTVISTNQLTVAVPASAIAASGTVAITVTNPATPGTGMYGSGGTTAETSSPVSFTID